MRLVETWTIRCAKCEKAYETEQAAGKCPHCGVNYEVKWLPKHDAGKANGEKK